MYFKVDRKILKKALVLLKQKQLYNKPDVVVENGNISVSEYWLMLADYINKIEFALYKTKMNEFYLDYDFAHMIRSALLTKEVKK